MTKEGLSGEVTLALTAKDEEDPAMRTFEETAFQAEGTASVDTSLGFREVIKGLCAWAR